jgi:DNA-binding IclR family transcriptional regulator
MGTDSTFAYMVTVEAGGAYSDCVVAGRDFATAVATARERLAAPGRLHRMEYIGKVLGHPTDRPEGDREPSPGTNTRVATAAAAVPEGSEVSSRRTRQDQLLTLLRERAGPVHLGEVARGLGINRGHADQVARMAIGAGLVRRVGRRTGQVEVVDDKPTVDVVPAVRNAGNTRVEQLVGILRARAAAVHIREIGEALGTNPGNVQNVVATAVKTGLVRRVGQKTGLVELAGHAQKQAEAEVMSAPDRVDQAELDGIQQRVYDAISTLADWSTASQVARHLGVRPREAGNALALLVDGGLVERRRGDGTPASRTRYRIVPR